MDTGSRVVRGTVHYVCRLEHPGCAVSYHGDCTMPGMHVSLRTEHGCDAERTVTLTEMEALIVARRLIGRLLVSDWLEWEEVPYFDEDSFDRLEVAVGSVASAFAVQTVSAEIASGIDGSALLERAETG